MKLEVELSENLLELKRKENLEENRKSELSYRSSNSDSKRRVVRGLNARSFSVLEQTACRLELRVRSFVQVIERHVVRMYRTTCRLEKEQTTCRFSCQTTSRSGSSDSNSSLIKTTSFWQAKTTPFWREPDPPAALFFFLLLRLLHHFSPEFLSLSHLSLTSRPSLLLSSLPRRPATSPEVLSLSLSSFFRHIFLYFVNMGPNEKLNF